ncbi:MAG TPA: NAD(P)/FAD-dependent oxidoreductase, partial [Alphaproteobacteria bacterium]|nr:NAD(P)/FAD-dependent oxidoreductase [Alphaproteobacteria bacterium]
EAVGKKILISGGGRCNFTNLHAGPDRYLSANRHFAISALRRYTARDFLALVERHRIPWHEKKLGQLFCDVSARDIVRLLLDECERGGVAIRTGCGVGEIGHDGAAFTVETAHGPVRAARLVMASGGLSIPKMGATGLAYRVAERFGLKIVPTRPALVPFTFAPEVLGQFKDLTGIAIDGVARCGKAAFRESLLLTHRGVSGPSILQVSSYWREGEAVEIDLLPDLDVGAHLKGLKRSRPRAETKTVLAELLPRRFVERLVELGLPSRPLADAPDRELLAVAEALKRWTFVPNGTEGYRTAEVTLGGVDTAGLSSQTLEAKAVPGLHFIGEAVDVTGHLGGFNFQWAWSSGWCAGMAV